MSNTTRNNTWIKKFFPVRTTHGGPPLIEEQPVAASQTITRGDPVTISSGELSLGAANSGSFYGVAAESVTTTAADEKTLCLVWAATRDTIFSGVSNAKTENIADEAVCDVAVSSGNWTLNIGANVEDIVRIKQHVKGDSVTDNTTPGRLEFYWERSQYDNIVADK